MMEEKEKQKEKPKAEAKAEAEAKAKEKGQKDEAKGPRQAPGGKATPTPTPAPAQEQGTEAEADVDVDVEALKGQLAQAEAQLRALQDRLKHLQADFENYKKRVQREQEELFVLMEDRLLAEVLPLYDSFERAFRSLDHNKDATSFIEGMERIFAQFSDHLKRKAIRPIEALGKRFDPLLMEALITVEHDGEPNMVLEEFERGYTRQGRVLRPSRVKVSRRPQDAAPAGAEQEKPGPGQEREAPGRGAEGEGTEAGS